MGSRCDKGLALGAESAYWDVTQSEARSDSVEQVGCEHCSPPAEKGVLPCWPLPPNEVQLCPPFPQGVCSPGSLWLVDGNERVRMEAVGKQDHKETKFALPQGTSLQGLPRFVSPGQPVHVPTSELKMEHRLTSVMGTKNNLGFSLCTAHTQGIVKFMPMSVMSVCANRLSHRQETSVRDSLQGFWLPGFASESILILNSLSGQCC